MAEEDLEKYQALSFAEKMGYPPDETEDPDETEMKTS